MDIFLKDAISTNKHKVTLEKTRKEGLIRPGLIIALGTFISRIFGLARELVLANFFGTSFYADVINTGLKFPNLFRRIFGEGALSAAFVPIYSAGLTKDKTHACKFLSQVFFLLLLALIIITIILELLMPQVVLITTPGFFADSIKYELAILTCRITTPYLIFICLAALLGGALSAHRKFGAFAFAPIILNICVIICCLLGDSDYSKTIFVSFGICVGGIIQLAFLLIASKNIISLSFFGRGRVIQEVFIFLKNMFPALVSNGSGQINIFFSHIMASFIPSAISILSYAERIYQFPLALIGICLGTILLPELSKLYAKKETTRAVELQYNIIIFGLILSVGTMAGLISLAHPLIHVIYERGAFVIDDTAKTSVTISIFALGLPAYVLVKILTPIFYAKLDTKTPMKVSLMTIAINCTLNVLFVFCGIGYIGIALGTSLAAWANVFMLYFFCRKLKIKITGKSILRDVILILLCSGIMSIILLIMSLQLKSLIYSSHLIIKCMVLLFLILIGSILFLSSCFLSGVNFLKNLQFRYYNKFQKN
ncbi:MAG: murein biosynthesis integral membrane protein MurJ [Rickettsiaceae bacterium]|nr:murein biosynthesis integral membrane protein MurJ [Rickettsiaceae bacterium]